MPKQNNLTFFWKVSEKRIIILLGFIIISTLIHTLGFYLFKVNHSISKKITPNTLSVSIIANNDDNRILYQQIENVAKHYGANLYETQIKKKSSSALVEYKSYLSNYKPNFYKYADIQKANKTQNINNIIQNLVNQNTIPPFQLQHELAPQEKILETPKISIVIFSKHESKISENRTIINNPKISKDNLSHALGNALTLIIGISPKGSVQFCFSQNGTGSAQEKSLYQEIINTLKFNPIKSENQQWGRISF